MDRRHHQPFQIPAMVVPPPLMNRPPQIFSAYSEHGLPIHAMHSEYTTPIFGDPSSLLDEVNEAKRRRIARACDMCRKKKIKCDGKLPACTHCINYKTDCVFTQVEKKRNPPKGAKYIEGLENRLGRMESLLRLSGLLGDGEDGATDLGALEKKLAEKQEQSRRASQPAWSPTSATNGTPTAADSPSSPGASTTAPESARETDESAAEKRKTLDKDKAKGKDNEDDQEAGVSELSEMMCSLVTTNSGESRYLGSSSGFSIFSPVGIQWVNEKMGDKSFQQMLANVSVNDNKWTSWKPEVFGDLFRRPIFKQLPPKAEALSLLKDYFENFNCMFPLFHQPTFMQLVERQYSGDSYPGSGWWASLNMALATVHRLRVMSKLVPEEEDEQAWGYFKNAMAVYPELTMRNTDLLSIQALLGMALFLQGTPNPQPSFVLVASAIRLAHSIGLHKHGRCFNFSPVEAEQRKRVFWIAYMLDKDFCLRTGRPPAQDDDDMNVDLPNENPGDSIGDIPLSDGKSKMNLFRVMCEFATIESKVYQRLYSTKATKQSDGELLNTIGELDQELEDWKDRIPIEFRPEHEIRASHTPLILHIVMLHFTYYNCLITIHRMSAHRGLWTSRLSNYAIQGLNTKPLNPRVFSSAALCTSAARASISLLKYVPHRDVPCVWLILDFPVSALVTLFGNILQNPLDARARSDSRLMNVVVKFLAMLGQEAETGGVHRMLGVCSEFERIAKAVLDKAEREHSSRRKRKSYDVGNAQEEAEIANILSPETPTPPSHFPTVASANPSTPLTATKKAAAAAAATVGGHLSPSFHANGRRRQSIPNGSNGYSPAATTKSQSPVSAQARWPHDPPHSGSYRGENNPPDSSGADSAGGFMDIDFASFADLTGFGQIGQQISQMEMARQHPVATAAAGGAGAPMPNTLFHQPMVSADLFNLPISFDWDWAEMGGGAYTGAGGVDSASYGALT